MIIIHELIGLYIWILIINALLSWFPTNSPSGAMATTKRVLHQLTEPVLRPIRQVLPRPSGGGMVFDISPMLAVVVLLILNRFI